MNQVNECYAILKYGEPTMTYEWLSKCSLEVLAEVYLLAEQRDSEFFVKDKSATRQAAYYAYFTHHKNNRGQFRELFLTVLGKYDCI